VGRADWGSVTVERSGSQILECKQGPRRYCEGTFTRQDAKDVFGMEAAGECVEGGVAHHLTPDIEAGDAAVKTCYGTFRESSTGEERCSGCSLRLAIGHGAERVT